jgi:hypothetical protein
MHAQPEELAYALAERSLRRQEEVLTEIRGRTGMLLAVSSLAASLLGGQALPDLDTVAKTALAGGASVALAVSIAMSLYVLVPNDEVATVVVGEDVYARLFASGADMAAAYRDLTYTLHRAWLENAGELARVVAAFRLAGLALATELGLLLLMFSGTIV